MSIAQTLKSVDPSEYLQGDYLLQQYHLINAENAAHLARIRDLEDEREQGRSSREAELETELAYALARCERYERRIDDYEARETWTRNLFANNTIPVACKLTLWYFWMSISSMRPSATGEEMRVSVEQTAAALGISTSTVRKATDKSLMFDVLERRYEDIKKENGEKLTLVHIKLDDALAHPEHVRMEKVHGGQRVKKCSKCGSEDVDRYTVQYCRECNENDWYVQPGTRDDAPYEKAQRAENRTVYGKGKKQDAFDASCTDIQEMPLCNNVTNEAPGPNPVDLSNRIDRAIDRIATQHRATSGTTSKKQDAFEDRASTASTVEQLAVTLDQAAPVTQLATQHSKPVTTASCIEMERRVATCRAQQPLNKDGKPAHALVDGHSEKIVSYRECGSTRWQWSEQDQRRVCAKCWTPQPE